MPFAKKFGFYSFFRDKRIDRSDLRDMRRIERDLQQELGGPSKASLAQKLVSQVIAFECVAFKKGAASILAGEGAAQEHVLALANGLVRHLTVLGLKNKAEKLIPSLAEYVARKDREAAKKAEAGTKPN